jgi:16S rRNA (uracil1498-N3)-methyltransferase
VGPEGGLEAGEVAALLDAGFNAVYLGPTVLRTETAAIYGIAAVRTVCREIQAWPAAY